jgi:uncharacterized iron-regulated protein
MKVRCGIGFILFCLFTGCCFAWDSIHNPVSVFDTGNYQEISFEKMVFELNRQFDVVFVGELHDDVITHQLELALLERLSGLDSGWNVSMEMFERDVQEAVNGYLEGELTEKMFLDTSRPWPNYQTDYRPLVEFVRKNKLDLVAANIPRRYASMIAKQGWQEIEKLPAEQRTHIAAKHVVIKDRYREEFIDTMVANMGGRDIAPHRAKKFESMYEAQCAKDDTMAESILDYLDRNPGKKIVHYNGKFHSDEHLGTVQKLARLNEKLRIGVVSIQPIDHDDIMKRMPEKDRKLGNFLIYCRRLSNSDSLPRKSMFKD